MLQLLSCVARKQVWHTWPGLFTLRQKVQIKIAQHDKEDTSVKFLIIFTFFFKFTAAIVLRLHGPNQANRS